MTDQSEPMLLVIEDDLTLARSIKSYFEDYEYQVLHAADGTEGLNLYFQHHPHVVITDLQLAGSIIQYARGASVIERTAQSLVDQFAQRLTAKIESGEEPDAEAIKVGSLLWHGIKSSVGGKSKNGGDGS